MDDQGNVAIRIWLETEWDAIQSAVPTRCTTSELSALDPNAATGIKQNGICSIKTCKPGYKLNNNKCTHTPASITDTLLTDYYAYTGINNKIYIQDVSNRIIEYNPASNTMIEYWCNAYVDATTLAQTPNDYNTLECWREINDFRCDIYGGTYTNNTCTITNSDKFLKVLDTKAEFPQEDNTPLPTTPTELCTATHGKWTGTECECHFLKPLWHETQGCTVSREILSKHCAPLEYASCISSENYSYGKCYSVSDSTSIPITNTDRVCKWVGTPDSGRCTIAQPYCD